MAKVTGKINASRVLAALGRIGYHPVSALLDIVDNSVSAGANDIRIEIETEQIAIEGKGKKTIVKSFLVIDNGTGMNAAGIENALSLGSLEEYYSTDTLSKFGMGLKSASSSLGKELKIYSRSECNICYKACLDQDSLEDGYEYDLDEADETELSVFNSYLSDSTGTVVKVSNIHYDCMPPLAEIYDGLKNKAGVIFYYYLEGKEPAKHRITLKLNGEDISPIDPLFVSKINDTDGDLNEHDWNGIDPKWITRPIKIALDSESACSAVVEMTQLPHPPSVAYQKIATQAECRREYMIGANNYGFYIYRNGRLISWADSLNGQIQLDQDLYSFRGRILISSDADDILNIDVTKSRIHLSELAKTQLFPLVQEAKKKSLEAWKRAKDEIKRQTENDPHAEISSELAKLGELDEKGDKFDEEASPEEEKKKLISRKKSVIESSPASEAEIKKLLEKDQRVQYVEHLEHSQLWARAHDPKLGLIVRVNSSHPINTDILSLNIDNIELIKLADILFYSLARAEYEVLYKTEFEERLVEKIMDEYRTRVGSSLSEVLRRLQKSD